MTPNTLIFPRYPRFFARPMGAGLNWGGGGGAGGQDVVSPPGKHTKTFLRF